MQYATFANSSTAMAAAPCASAHMSCSRPQERAATSIQTLRHSAVVSFVFAVVAAIVVTFISLISSLLLICPATYSVKGVAGMKELDQRDIGRIWTSSAA